MDGYCRIHPSKPIEQQAQQAYELRNQVRTTARDSMSDRVAAEFLYDSKPNKSFDELVFKYQNEGLSGNDLYKEIIAASQRSNPEVNAFFGLNSVDFKWAFSYPIPSIYAATESGVLLEIGDEE